MAWTADCTVPYPVTTTTTASGLRSPIWCRASSPPAPGNFRSSSTTSMFCVSNIRYACSAGVRHHGVEAERLRHVTADFPDGPFVVHDQEIEKVRPFDLSGTGDAECGCAHGASPLYFRIRTFGPELVESDPLVADLSKLELAEWKTLCWSRLFWLTRGSSSETR